MEAGFPGQRVRAGPGQFPHRLLKRDDLSAFAGFFQRTHAARRGSRVYRHHGGPVGSTASLLKFYAGRLSDRLNRRKPLALAGYAISGAVRPFTAVAAAGWHVVFLRLSDRIGKGIRSAPRDALLSESVPADVRGLAFSFHRLRTMPAR